MKSAPIPDYNSTIDEPNERWSLSWKPDGYCDKFTREAILACAPSASGIYGLFNFDCQIFIGESANIRKVLLRLERQADFSSEFLRPTGFTFELCPEESRKQKASELIARYRPALQIMAAAAEPRLPSSAPMRTLAGKAAGASDTHAGDLEFPGHGGTPPNVRRPFQFTRRRHIALAILLIVSAVAFHFFMSLDHAQSRKNGASENLSAVVAIPRSSALNQAGQGSRRQEVPSINVARQRAKSDDDPTPGKPNGAVRFAKASGMDEPDVQTLSAPAKTTPTNDNRGKKWSVQLSAAPAKDVADSLAQRLIAKGYNGYVAQAEVKGQTYYRVRVGPFDAREEAESARQSLARQEEYRGAYLTGD